MRDSHFDKLLVLHRIRQMMERTDIQVFCTYSQQGKETYYKQSKSFHKAIVLKYAAKIQLFGDICKFLSEIMQN